MDVTCIMHGRSETQNFGKKTSREKQVQRPS
jgi:hypothetical protein